MKELKRKFTSSNEMPVERAIVTQPAFEAAADVIMEVMVDERDTHLRKLLDSLDEATKARDECQNTIRIIKTALQRAQAFIQDTDLHREGQMHTPDTLRVLREIYVVLNMGAGAGGVEGKVP